MMSKALQCLVLDDEPIAARLLARYIELTPDLFLVRHTTRVDEAIKLIRKEQIDILFLDIQMPEMNGLEFMQLCGDAISVIFTTAYRDYAVDGFEKNAVDYLLKPVTYERFMVAVNKVKKRRVEPHNNPGYLFVKTGFRQQRIDHDAIFYIEALRDYIVFHTKEGKVIVSESMTAIESMLPKAQFIRIHRSFIINMSRIDFVEKWSIGINGASLPVGVTYREKLMSTLGMK